MRRVLVVLLVLVAAAVVAPSALGKGASEATISGPGVEGPIRLGGEGQEGGELLMWIAEQSGFFPSAFPMTPDPMLEARPAGELGPRYVVTYVMPGPNNEEDTLVQHLYPYAQPSPVSYMEPGTSFWSTRRTQGGWYVASSQLLDALVEAGLPREAPTSAPTDGSPVPPWIVVALVVGLAVAAAAFVRMRTARRDPAAA
jgi:hypothetical protein